MILTVHHDDSAPHWWSDARHPNRKIALATLLGAAAIAAAVFAAAAAAGLGLGPRLEPVVYLFVGLAAVVLWVTYMFTFVKGTIAPGLSYIGFWATALVVTYLLFYAFG